MWGNEKMLDTSIFSLSHNVFKSLSYWGLLKVGIVLYRDKRHGFPAIYIVTWENIVTKRKLSRYFHFVCALRQGGSVVSVSDWWL